jgi:hypothetical protein
MQLRWEAAAKDTVHPRTLSLKHENIDPNRTRG